MRAGLGYVAGLAMLVAGGALAQVPEAVPLADDDVFIPASLEKVADGFTFTEGPAWDGERLIFSDIPGDTVCVLTPGGGAPGVLYTPSALANGHTFDREGRLINAEHGSGTITRWTPEDGRQVVVAAFEGRHLSSPNDVIVRSDWLILFTDPPYGLRGAYQGSSAATRWVFGRLRLRRGFGQDGADRRCAGTAQRPCLSPDERVLYVGDSATQTLWAYDIAADGSASNRRLFADLKREGAQGSVDRVRVDSAGRVFTTCPGGVARLRPAARCWRGSKRPSAPPTSPGAEPDLSDLYITALGDVYRVKTRARGIGSSSRR